MDLIEAARKVGEVLEPPWGKPVTFIEKVEKAEKKLKRKRKPKEK